MCCKKRIEKTLFRIAKTQKLSRLRRAVPHSTRIVKLRYTFHLLIRTLGRSDFHNVSEKQGFVTFHRGFHTRYLYKFVKFTAIFRGSNIIVVKSEKLIFSVNFIFFVNFHQKEKESMLLYFSLQESNKTCDKMAIFSNFFPQFSRRENQCRIDRMSFKFLAYILLKVCFLQLKI